ncbi:MAG: hypothetical protein CL581_09535 [Alteromonadaceae bacterium]|jgi:hypothetical protein|nr:hypothetical protein [Alteromonadaceae bacterium]|tara:strand:+ start:63 stop:452 length:390 start_codon:yes stop_codon:yes gene_type:complete
MTTVKENIITTLNTNDINDSDNFMRRHFRLFIEGSYGNGSMDDHLKTVKTLHDIVNRQSPKAKHNALRSWVIYQHTSFIATKFGCSKGYAQWCVVQALDESALQRYTIALMADAMDFYFDNKSALEVNE